MDTEVNFFPRTFNHRKITLRETNTYIVMIGSDKTERQQHFIKIIKRKVSERDDYELEDILEEDLRTYNKEEMKKYVLDPLINKTDPTIQAKTAHGILGFIRFLKGFYLILITARKKVAKIG